MLSAVKTGARVAMTPREVDALAGNGPVRIVTCDNGCVMAGTGQVGFIEHLCETDLAQMIELVKAKRAELSDRAKQPNGGNPQANLYEFVKI